ncbi:hypothetical protein SAMN02745133_02169 [Desulforamulus putei DSM 12395]|uniref:Uncharacterized protein n=1 Tax=Desulforamulus putei DSM 12395 TaxID=1121429 RepID=A0A1M5A5J2_9FIRM|nr:hypothetical protein [Desulforamulus putei]SHF25266.1 hypothetical protein SAMN02745133_02169 [Desulforamulus putei DSM 12395]
MEVATQKNTIDQPSSPDAKPMDLYSQEFLNLIMFKQLRLSLALFAVFVVILLGLPLVNFYLPSFANARIFGFTGSWLFLGVLFYPLTWAVAYIYVKLSLDLEHAIAKRAKKF